MADSFNHFADIAVALPGALETVITKTAFDAQANIQAQIRANDQVDTGNMLNSVHVEDGEDDLTKYVVVGASYGWYQNYGTKFIAARPFFEPGLDATRPGFEAAISAVEQKFKEVS